MAKRYGGKFSPEGAPDNARPAPELPVNRFRGARAQNSNIRSKLLFLAPLPLLFAAIGELRAGDITGMVWELGAFASLILAAWLLRDGLKAQAAYEARKVSRPPAIPRKLFAAGFSGLGIGIASYFGWGQPMIPSLLLAAVGIGAHIASFGLDPMKKKGMEGMSEFDMQRVAKAVEKGEGLLRETLEASKRMGDRKLQGRVEKMARAARDMFRAVEEDPRDLTGARKFMGVYLKGARDASVKFADLYSKKKDQQARTDYEALLDDLERSFAAQRDVMLLEDRTDLDVEIEVLRDRLKQEGIRAPK